MSFRDHRGAGGIFRMIPARAISAEQLGLSREIQGLCAEPEGLVLVTGLRSSGRSTLISAFVDLINRTRNDHVITLESQIKFVHESRGSVVSQREVRGDKDELLSVARSALRENPDVLVIEDLRSPEIITVALEAAQSGHLVIGALTAHTATAAVDRIIDQTSPERRPKVQLALAEALRGIVAQVLLRKTGGGRVAAREVLLNTSAVANLIAEGKTSQLPMAIDSGRKHGMVPLNDALAAFVQNGTVDSREAYRFAFDRPGFLNLLKRQGIDTSPIERLA
jgi:twitching motility protein PilT